MDIFETDVEMAQRHVAQAERLLQRQKVLVAALAGRGRDVETAQQTLAVFEAALDVMRRHLALEEVLAHGPAERGPSSAAP